MSNFLSFRSYTGKDEKASVPTLVTGIFGVIAGAASVFGNTPVDVVKTRMQVSWKLILKEKKKKN